MSIRLKLSKHDDSSILCQAISGIDHFGFGTFLCDILPEEIQADEFSKLALINAHEKSGLNGMEIWEDNRIAWGDPAHKLVIPINEISKAKGATNWLLKLTTNE